MKAKQIKLFKSRVSDNRKKYLTNNVTNVTNKRSLTKILFTLICSIILALQTWEQLTDYLRFETITMIQNEDQRLALDIPSVSICQKYPLVKVVLPNRTVNTRIPAKFIKDYEKYGIITKFRGFHALDLTLHKMPQSARIVSNGFNVLKERSITMKDKFDDFNEQKIQCLLVTDEIIKCYTSFSSVGMVSQCQTYFSEIGSDGKIGPKLVYHVKSNDKGSGVSMVAFFAINFTEYYRDKENLSDVSLYAAVHHTKASVGSERATYTSRRFVFKKNTSYDLSYIKKTVKKLQAPYQTDCHEYGSSINSTDIYNHSRELCLNKCMLDRTLKRYGCLTSYADLIQGEKYTKEDICNNSVLLNIDSNDSIYTFEFKSWIYCHKNCKPECNEETYIFDLNEVYEPNLFDLFGIDYNSTDITFISVLDMKASESRFYHWPKMKLCGLLSNIGGLFSLWLGLSILNIFDFMTALCSCKVIKTT